jgi:transcriptional regulator with XRE-family HTH domain
MAATPRTKSVKIRPDLLVQAREASRLSQEDFAADIGITRVWLSQLELGKKDPGMTTLDKLGDILGKDTVANMIVDDTQRATYLQQLLADKDTTDD